MTQFFKSVLSLFSTLWFLFFQWVDEVDLKGRKNDAKEAWEKIKSEKFGNSSKEDESAKLNYANEHIDILEERIKKRLAYRLKHKEKRHMARENEYERASMQ